MKLLFVSTAYPKELYRQLSSDSNGQLSVPMDIFQWSIIEGLEECGVDYSIVSLPSLPAWPRYRHLFSPQSKMRVNETVRGECISYCDLPAIKQISQEINLSKYVKRWCEANKEEERLHVLIFTQQADKLRAIIQLKRQFKNLIISVIVTDLIENAKYYVQNRKLLKQIQLRIEQIYEHKLFPYIDSFVLLSRLMVDYIPEAEGRSIVVEGIAQKKQVLLETSDIFDKSDRILLYTGILEEYAGINLVVDAFVRTKNPNYRLVVCGVGPSADYILSASKKDNRIVYRGSVSHEEVIILQQKATALINPRRPDGGITKYSFPSKTMEYMMSGTPMIGYKLEGIPEEYYDYMYIPENLSIDKLTDCIQNTLSKPQEELDAFAEKAKGFVMCHKNCVVQVRRIIDFIDNNK